MPSGPDRQTGSHRPGHPRFSGPPWPRTWKSNRNERYDFNRPGFRHSPRWPRPSTVRIKRATNRTTAGLPDSGIPRKENSAARTPSFRRLTCRNIRLYLRPICLESIKFYNFVSICTFRYTGKTKNYLIKNTMANKEQKLFAEFPPVTTERWEEAIKADLKGADYEKKLVWKTAEGFNVRPYYRAENLEGLRFLGSPLRPGNQEKQRLADPANDRSRVPARGQRPHSRATDQGSRIHRTRDRQQGILGGRSGHAARRRLAA